jgi:hypothetical protein
MFSLIKKDLLIQKSYLFYLIFVALIAIISFSGLKGAIFLPVTFILTYVFMQHACYCDDKNNAHLLLNSLPLSRKKIVLSRYLSLFVFFTISLGFCAVLGWISELIFSDFIHFSFPVEGVAAVLAAVLLMNSIGLPVFYTFGYSKARIVNVILFIGIFNAFLFWESAGKFIANFFNKGSLFSGYFVLNIAFFIYALSYVVSAKIYSKREF